MVEPLDDIAMGKVVSFRQLEQRALALNPVSEAVQSDLPNAKSNFRLAVYHYLREEARTIIGSYSAKAEGSSFPVNQAYLDGLNQSTRDELEGLRIKYNLPPQTKTEDSQSGLP